MERKGRGRERKRPGTSFCCACSLRSRYREKERVNSTVISDERITRTMSFASGHYHAQTEENVERKCVESSLKCFSFKFFCRRPYWCRRHIPTTGLLCLFSSRSFLVKFSPPARASPYRSCRRLKLLIKLREQSSFVASKQHQHAHSVDAATGACLLSMPPCFS